MNKSILKAVAVAAVAIMFSLGCSDTDGDGNGTDEQKKNHNSDKYALTIAATSGGSVSPAAGTHYYDAGTSVPVTATANIGYTFSKWEGASSSTSPAITITMDGNKMLTARFQEDATGSGGIVGDWSVVSAEFNGEVEPIPDDSKMFYSLKSSNDLVITQFDKYGDFWIESVQEVGKYSVKDDSVCVDGTCNKYSISGNNITFSLLEEYCGVTIDGNYECNSIYVTYNAIRDNLASTKGSLGNSLKSQDPALNNTVWERLSSDTEHGWCSDKHIEFWVGYFSDSCGVYIPDDVYSGIWYTEGGNRLTLVAMGCDEYDADGWGREECVSYTVSQTVKLDYQLANGTLRLKANGKNDWDEWTPYSPGDGGGCVVEPFGPGCVGVVLNDSTDVGSLNKSKAKAKSKKDIRPAPSILLKFPGSRF